MDKQQNTIFIRLLFPLLLALPFPFTLMNCARESAPLGGPVDTIEPYAVLEKPMNNSQNINPKKIVVKFNEFIALENIEDNCMISPVMEETPSITVKKKKLTIDLSKQKLQSGTTYSFNFNNAIKDLTEDNVTEQYLYAFSTGAGIDSMKVSGTITSARNKTIPEKTYVLLYDDLSDSAFQTQKPRYITQASKRGDFSFSNIEAKPYRIYALVDSDKDFTFNQPSESIGFLDSVFTPTAERYIDTVWYSHNDTTRFEEYEDSILITQVKDSFKLAEKTRWAPRDIKLSIFENEVWKQSVLSGKRISKYAYGCKFATDVQGELSVKLIPEKEFVQELTAPDSLIIWLTDTTLQNCDSLVAIVTYQENKNSQKMQSDTLKIEALKDLPDRLDITSNLTKNPKIFPKDTVFLTLSRPADKSLLDKIALYQSCDTSKTTCEELFSFSDAKFRPKKHYARQEILRHKETNDRFALFFSKPTIPQDVKVTLDGLPNLTDWYYCERDEKSNALLFWIKPESDALKLKNQAITVEFTDENGTVQKLNFNDKKDVPVQKMYKKPSSNKRLLVQLRNQQKDKFKAYEPLEIICNNPIASLTDSLFSLVNTNDSTETSIITNVTISPKSSRIIVINHTAKAGETYSLELKKGALVDTFKSASKDFVAELQTEPSDIQFVQKKNFSLTPTDKNGRKYALTAEWDGNTSYYLVIPDSTFHDVFGDANDSLSFSFQCPKMDNVGNLIVKNTKGLPSQNLVFYVESEAKEPETFYASKTDNGYRFDNIPMGSYSLRCYVDENNNNKWDTGCIEIKRQPEKIYFFKTSVSVKAEWDNTIYWEEFEE